MNGMFWALMVGITGWLTGLAIGQGASFSRYAIAVLGSATLVAPVRLAPTPNLFAKSR